MSEYSKDQIELNWKILNGAYSHEDKKNADKYLIAFKVFLKFISGNPYIMRYFII